MPKRMHDISMERWFRGESIDTKFAQLCAKNGKVYTPTKQRSFFICLKQGYVSVFQALDRGFNRPSTEGFTDPRSRVCQTLDRGFVKPPIEVLIALLFLSHFPGNELNI